MIIHRDLIRNDDSRESTRLLLLDEVVPQLGSYLLKDGVLYELLAIETVSRLESEDRSESQYYRHEWYEVGND